MRQQKGIDDDNQRDIQLERGNHQERYCREERDDKEVGDDYQEEGGHSGGFSIAVT